MLRINSLGVVLMLMIVIAVGCSTTQEKSSIMVEGAYRFRSTITDSNCIRQKKTYHTLDRQQTTAGL